MNLMGTHKKWRWRRDPVTSESSITPEQLARQTRQHPLIAQLLLARGIEDPNLAQKFLSPKLTDLHEPANLPGVQRAALRMEHAVQTNQPIVIYGDYDVDGVTASAILYHTLDLAGACVSCYVPHRLDEGYGLNSEALEQIATGQWYNDPDNRIANKTPNDPTAKPLIISVDCGITAIEQAQLAKQIGIDLIITDHHHFDPDNLPNAHTLVHPRIRPDLSNTQIDNQNQTTPSYPFGDLCGAGVAFKLAWQFAKIHNNLDDTSANLPTSYRNLMVDLLSFVALGTVADVVPLIDENRALVVFGLGRIKNTSFTGLNALIDAAKLRDEKVDAYHVGFVLGPRLNACGRMGHARDAVYLLTKANAPEAAQLASFLTLENDNRKKTEREIVKQAKIEIETQGYASPDQRAIIIGNTDWHKGVVGIVASRIVETYHRPTVVLSYDEDGIASGSARSISGFDVHAAFTACAAHLDKFGGHEAAAGCTLKQDQVNAFRSTMIDHTNSILDSADLVPTAKIDAELNPQDISLDLFQMIQALSPFGNRNPKPVLLLRNLQLTRAPQRIGSGGDHLSLNLEHQGVRLRAVGFGFGDDADKLTIGMHIDLVFNPAINTWMNRSNPDFHIVDYRIVIPHDNPANAPTAQSSFA
ncbi:single-stranded-DNA-specific exonuclease RecJ [Poriferisphaera sp. WC338]|uniref:single-stranded-DNA-specific exonuclease RecJ n=1 Tax=Poriferisphaera sp. WC338 TaxID=3425129 RepID=UPI003D8153E2